MTRRYTHWCPNGCGKKVVYTGMHPTKGGCVDVAYYCKKCGMRFDNKHDLEISLKVI